MVYIFHGKDPFLRQAQVAKLIRELGLPKVAYTSEAPPEKGEMLGTDLFGGVRILVLSGLLSELLGKNVEHVSAYKESSNHIIFVEDALDKRLTLSKQLLGDKDIISVVCDTPQGKELAAWIEQRTGELGGTIAKPATDLLMERLGFTIEKSGYGQKESSVSLAHVNTELQKLVVYAAGENIMPAMVELLVTTRLEVTGFEIVNALAEKDKKKLFSLITQFYEQDSTDEKARTIQLNSLLAEQFRNLLTVQDLQKERAADALVLELTGWKSGRLFVIKKIASRFSREHVVQTLGKLESLDMELKSGTIPPQVLLDVILVPLLWY